MKTTFLFFVTCIVFQLSSQQLYNSASFSYRLIEPGNRPPSFLVNSYHQIVTPWFWQKETIAFQHSYNAAISFGYQGRRNIGYEISASLAKSTKSTTLDEVITKTFSSRFFSVNPKISITAHLAKTELYTKLGLVIFNGTISYDQQLKRNADAPGTGISEATLNYSYTGNVSLGFSGAIGVTHPISKRWSVFGEISAIHQSFSPTKGVISKHTVNHENQLPLPTFQEEIDFGGRDESYYTSSPNGEDRPQKLYRTTISLSGIELLIGVKFILWKKGE